MPETVNAFNTIANMTFSEETTYTGSKWYNIIFVNCDFSDGIFDGCIFNSCLFKDCTFDSNATHFVKVEFLGCSLVNSVGIQDSSKNYLAYVNGQILTGA